MTRDQLRQAILDASFYADGNGHAGYLLTDRRIDAILAAVDTYTTGQCAAIVIGRREKRG